jgi:predicted RND superfamily exporter protein
MPQLPKLAHLVLRHRGVLFALLMGMTAVSAWGLLAGRGVLGGGEAPPPSEEESLFEEMLSDFGVDGGECLLVIEGDDLLGPEQVAITRKLVAAVEAVPAVDQVLWVDRIPSFAAGPLPLPLLPPDSSGPAAFRRSRDALLAHPLIGGHLLARDESLWVLPILFDRAQLDGLKTRGEEPNVLPAINAALERVKLSSAMSVCLAGTMPLAADGERAFEHEQLLFNGIAYVGTFFLAAWLFRSFWAVILTGGGPVLGVLWTFGLLSMLGEQLNGLTRIILPVMIMMIGFTDSVHLMIHVQRERSRGLTPLAAADSAVRTLLLPCWLTSFTTALGFGSLLFARTELIQDFGFASLIGSICTFLAVVTFLPLFASTRLGLYLEEKGAQRATGGALPFAGSLVEFLIKRSRWVTAAGVLITLVSLALGTAIETDNRVLADVPESSPASRALRRIDEAIGGTVPVTVLVEWDEAHAQDWDSILAATSAGRARLAAEPEFAEPLSLGDLLEALPPTPSGELVDRVGWLERAPASVRDKLIQPEARMARVETLLPDLGYEHFRDTFATLEQDLDELSAAHPGFTFYLTGQAVISGFLFGEVTTDLIQSLALASLTIFIVLAFSFHSLRLGLISVIPNAFPLAATAALLVLLDVPMAGATAFVMSLGIAVDDTIHVIARFRREHDAGHDLEDAIRQAVQHVGKALVITTVVLVIGFAPVLTSEFPRTRVFAAMICVTIGAALVGDLVILPAMLKAFGEGRPFRRKA